MPPAKPANRPMLLAIVMLALLAFSVLGASALVHLKGGVWRIALTEPQTIGSMELRLPSGWEVDYHRRGGTEFIDAHDAKTDRKLSIRASDIDERIGPMDFLLNSDLVRLMTLEREDIRLVEDLNVPGGKGFIIHPKSGTPLAVITYANRAVMVQLADPDGSSASDDAIVYHVANSIRFAERPAEPRRAPRTEREI